MRSIVLAASLYCLVALAACPGPAAGPDGGSTTDAGSVVDAGFNAADAGHDGGASPGDAGTDAGVPDAGPVVVDGGTDGGARNVDGGSVEGTKCLSTGGSITDQLCCGSATDFPNLCSIGACGCSPSNSHTIKICSCPGSTCFEPAIGCH